MAAQQALLQPTAPCQASCQVLEVCAVASRLWDTGCSHAHFTERESEAQREAALNYQRLYQQMIAAYKAHPNLVT